VTVVVVLACILVSGLELYAVTRVRQVETRNGQLETRNAELLRRLDHHERKIESFASSSVVEGRFTEERGVAEQWRGHIEASLEALRARAEAVRPQITRLDEQRLAGDGRIHELETAARRLGVRLDETRSEIIALADTSEVRGLLSDLEQRLPDEQVKDLQRKVNRLESDFRAYDRRLPRLDTRLSRTIARLDGIEPSAHEHPTLAQTLDSLDETVKTVFGCLLRIFEERVAAALTSRTAGVATVRGALLVESETLPDALSRLFEDYVEASGATIRLRWGSTRLTRYYLELKELRRFERICTETIGSTHGGEVQPTDRPSGRIPEVRLRSLLLGMGRVESGFAQLGPLAITRTKDSFACGVLDPTGLRAFDVERCLEHPDRAPDEIARHSAGRFFDMTSLTSTVQ
jgi:hypothetical protein